MNVNGLVWSKACRGALLTAVVALAGCRHDRVLAASRDFSLQVTSGDVQSAPAGSLLPRPLSVVVRDVAGQPVRGTVVIFRITRGAANGAALLDSLAVTNDAGQAMADLRLPARPDTVDVIAFPGGSPERGIALRAIATAGPELTGVLPANVGPGDTLALAGSALGGVGATVEIGGARVSPVSGGSGELRVVVPDCLAAGPLNVRVLSGTAWTATRPVTYTPRRRTVAAQRYQPVTVDANALAGCLALATEGQAQYLVVPQLAVQGLAPTSQTVRISVGGVASSAIFTAASLGSGWKRTADDAQRVLDHTLRESERALAPLARDAVRGYRPPMLALTLGSLRTFRVITDLDGSKFATATGKLRFLGKHLGIYMDTSTATSMTDDQLAKLGKLFDDDLYPTNVAAFGPESDIDRNERVLVFMTPRVNSLVAAADCGQKGYVSGFFYGRDLVPALPNSNEGEIFYSLVPDPAARYSCSHATFDVTRSIPGVFIHEFQHMISFYHHAIARGGEAEATWLNEGLSHIAEEMGSRLFEQRYPAPFGRSTPSQLFPDSASGFISPQMLNAYIYLSNPGDHSVTTFAGSGSIEERGAAWLFLRWLGDQKGDQVFRQLVQTSQTGVANIEARAGEPFARLFGDFSVTLFTDSIVGLPRDVVAPRYRFASRNLRQLMAREAVVQGFPNPFPIVSVRVPFDGYAEGPIIPGTMVYAIFGPVPDGTGSAALTFSKAGGGLFGGTEGAQVSIVRIK